MFNDSANAAALRRALQQDELQLVFQPQVATAGGELVAVLALPRWDHPQLGAIGPARLGAAAARAGLAATLADWVLRRAVQVASHWQHQGLPPLRMLVPTVAGQWQDGALGPRVERLLDETSLAPRWLGLEVSESARQTDWTSAALPLQRLRGLGVEITLAGFGAAHSSLGLLRQLPLDAIKLDRSLLRDVVSGSDGVPILRAVAAMAHGLGLQAVAEDVQSEGQREMLATEGFDRCQGPHIGTPLGAEPIELMLRAGHRLPAPGTQPAAAARNVLIVGADGGMVGLMARKLAQQFGQRVRIDSCVDPLQALHRLRSQPYDLLVSDLRMPRMDGIELLGLARQAQPDAVRMMVLGTSDLAQVLDDERQVDVFRYLSRPWTPRQLTAHFEAALERVEQRRAGATPHRTSPPADCGPLGAVGAPADVWELPTQLPTMPGDLWTPRAAALHVA